MNKTSIILLVILIIVLGFGVYYFYQKNPKQNSDTSQTKKQNTNQETVSTQETQTQTSTQTQESASSSTTPTTSSTPTVKSDGWRDCAEFTSEETSTMIDWLTYTNETYNYRFRYPQTWLVDTTSTELVTVAGEDSGEALTFKAEVGSMIETDFSGFTLTFTRDFILNCENTTEKTYDGPDNLTFMTYSFTKSDISYLLKFSYRDIGASWAGDIYDLDKMILKTFAFRE